MTTSTITNTSASAPTLNGTAGSLLSLFDYALVNGATGVTPFGWERQYYDAGTKLAVYRSAQSSGTPRCCLWVDDNNAQYAMVRGYNTMSDVNTGTGPFPTAAQRANGLYVRKSWTSDSTARSWTIVGDEYGFILWNYSYYSSGYGQTDTAYIAGPFMFGDFLPLNVSDTGNCLIAGNAVNTADGYPRDRGSPVMKSSSATYGGGCYLAKNYAGTANSPVASFLSGPLTYVPPTSVAAAFANGYATAYPDVYTNRAIVTPVYIGEGDAIPRGILPYWWEHIYSAAASLNMPSTLSSVTGLPGRTFMTMPAYTYSVASGNAAKAKFVVQTSDLRATLV